MQYYADSIYHANFLRIFWIMIVATEHYKNRKKITNIALKSGRRRLEGRVLQRDIGIVVPVSRFAFMDPERSLTI